MQVQIVSRTVTNMICHLKKEKNILALTVGLALILFVACREKLRYDPNLNPQGQSILDIEYINDTLDINVVDFRVSDLEQGKQKMEIFVITEMAEEYSRGYSFFIHLYPKISTESDQNFIALGTKSIDSLDGVLIYEREFKLDETYFEQIRYGLLNEEGERLFTLTLDSVRIE